MADSIGELIERIVEIASGLGFLLPFAIVLILRMFSGKSKSPDEHQAPRQSQQRPQQQPVTRAEPKPEGQGDAIPIPGFPFAPPAWMQMDQPTAEQPAEKAKPAQWRDKVQPASQWGHSFDRNDDREDEALKWGSAFDYEDGEPVRWGSAFDFEDPKTKYGFQKATWGGTFPKKSTEPVIHLG
jgi:hypothetical protein